jgi:hypothetical protein
MMGTIVSLGQPLHVTVAEAEQRRKERTRDARRRAAATLNQRLEDPLWSVSQRMMTVLMIERHKLQMMLGYITCYVTCNIIIWRCYITKNGVI